MEKIASDAQLDNTQLQKIAAYGFGVALSTPAAGFTPEVVKTAADRFITGLQKRAARHNSIVELLRSHLAAA